MAGAEVNVISFAGTLVHKQKEKLALIKFHTIISIIIKIYILKPCHSCAKLIEENYID